MIHTYPLGLSRLEWNTRTEVLWVLVNTQDVAETAKEFGVPLKKMTAIIEELQILECEWLKRMTPGQATQAVRTLAEHERAAIVSTARQVGTNKSTMARVLGIGRQTLYNKIEQYNITAAEMAGTTVEGESN